MLRISEPRASDARFEACRTGTTQGVLACFLRKKDTGSFLFMEGNHMPREWLNVLMEQELARQAVAVPAIGVAETAPVPRLAFSKPAVDQSSVPLPRPRFEFRNGDSRRPILLREPDHA